MVGGSYLAHRGLHFGAVNWQMVEDARRTPERQLSE